MDAKKLKNDELAHILECMIYTGICPSSDEKEYLREAAYRLCMLDDPQEVTKGCDE